MPSADRWNTSDPLRSLPSTYCGRKATQWFVDFTLWERLLNAHLEVEAIVELGTGEGGFSWYLYHQALARGLNFATFDRERPQTVPPGFYQADIFEHPEVVWRHLDQPCVLFCDDGDKPRELATFATRLLPASICVVHDWGDEVQPSDVPLGLVYSDLDLWEVAGITAVFAKEPR